MSYADERRTKALESIARELKGIGQSLKRIEEKTIPPFRDRDPLAEAKAALIEGDVEIPSFHQQAVDAVKENPSLVHLDFTAYCYNTGLPCCGCTTGECDYRYTVGGGNG